MSRGRKRDPYQVLGVPRNATVEQVRQVFQELALRHHPDRAGSEHTGAFQEIAEAYQVLCDPEQRARHDRGIAKPEEERPRRQRRPCPVPEPLPRRQRRPCPKAEPLPRRQRGPRPKAEPLLRERGKPPPAFSSPRELVLALDPVTASRGGPVLLVLPLEARCPLCGVRDWLCLSCGGRGWIRRELPLRLWLPPFLTDGARIPLEVPGIGPIELRVRVG